jgi:hypothetical protein
VPPSSHQRQLQSAAKQAAQLLYGSTAAIFALSGPHTDDIVANAYHPVPCARARAQAAVCASADLLPPVVAACADVSRWRAAAHALDGEAHRAWRASKVREQDRITAELDREGGRRASVSGSPAEDEEEALPSGLSALRSRHEELAALLAEPYSAQTDVWGPHLRAVPVRLYANLHVRVAGAAGSDAPLVARSRIVGDAEAETVGALAARVMPGQRYGADVVFVSQGVELGAEVPLRWAYAHFRHPSLWLHLVVTAARPK